jgi:hypothetical protein
MTFAWREWTRGQWLLRTVVLLGPLVALAARWPSDPPRVWLVLLTLVLSAGWAVAPESVVGAVTLLLVAFSWVAGTPGDLPATAMVAGVAMLAAHLAALVASYGPDALPVSPSVVRLWLWRGLGVALVAPFVWLAALAVREAPGSSTVWLLGLAVALSVTIVAAAATQVATPSEDS